MLQGEYVAYLNEFITLVYQSHDLLLCVEICVTENVLIIKKINYGGFMENVSNCYCL